ncbi:MULTISPECIES: hypothetical protein [Nocardioides]|uniref:Uncharacterized protein n=1 Tax=Nocardioides vastitatis TaxID=2568655 RepID=A0ABW0ZG20_9ACTN|nr:hypothetical protein [Nocardioides sp.]
MIFLLLIVVAAAVAGTLRVVVRDERGRGAPPASHPVDSAWIPPAMLLERR